MFQNVRHPVEMRAAEIEKFLSHLAVEKSVAASTQNQAFAALLFLYREISTTMICAHVLRRHPLGVSSPGD